MFKIGVLNLLDSEVNMQNLSRERGDGILIFSRSIATLSEMIELTSSTTTFQERSLPIGLVDWMRKLEL